MNEKIVEYIRANRDRFAREVLREKLLGAGYQPDEVDEALAAESAATTTEPLLGRDLRPWAGAVVLVAYVGTFVAFSLSNLSSAYFGQTAMLVLTVMLALALLISLGVVRRSRRLARGGAAALVVLFVPLILLVAVSGLCVGPAFGPRY